MTEHLHEQESRLVNDVDGAIAILREAGQWLVDSGRTPSKWWDPNNLTKDFLFQYANPEEFFVMTVSGKNAGAAVIQIEQEAQDWTGIDRGKQVLAMYIHWLCVSRDFAGKGLPEKIMGLAAAKAKTMDIDVLRVDTDAGEVNLRHVYESIGFELVDIVDEDYRQTAFYQMSVE